MALIVNDRVRESTTVTGTGTATLLGAIAGYQAFSVIGNGNTCYYTISDQLGANWEVGIGTYTLSGATLARTTVLKSSNANALVSFTAGTKDVFVTYPAGTAVSGGGGGEYPTIQPTLNLDFANTRQLDPRITFVRNSTATYYDGQTSAMAEQNLLTYSQDFSNGVWAKGTASVVGGFTAPDGTTTAYTVTATAIQGYVTQNTSTPLGTGATAFAYSVYLKAGTVTNCRVYLYSQTGGNNTYVDVDLTAGTIGSPSGGWANTPFITNVGTGWYRVGFVTTPSAAAYNGNAGCVVYNLVNTGTFQAWGAQLEQRSSATAYTPTTTSTITNYIPVLMTAPVGVARFDCDPITGKSLGLLIEESRTNLLTYSSDFNLGWGDKAPSTVLIDTNIGMDGTQTADTITKTGATGAWGDFGQAVSVGAGGNVGKSYTISMWAWVTSGTQIVRLGISDRVYNTYSSSNITLTTTPTRITFTSSGGAGWNALGTAIAGGFYSIPLNTPIIVWGAQLEAGSFATSYINTVASTVTRAADQASMTGTNFSSWYNQAQGAFYAEGATNGALNSAPAIIGDTGGYQGVIAFSAAAFTYYNGTSNISASSAPILGVSAKVAVSGTSITRSICANGGNVVTSSTPLLTTAKNGLSIGVTATTAEFFNGTIKKISYYPVALSSSNLVALTS